MADASNPLIAALRANSPASARQASGPVALNYPWMQNTVLMPREPTGGTTSGGTAGGTAGGTTPRVTTPGGTTSGGTTPIKKTPIKPPDTNQTMQMSNLDWDNLNANYSIAYQNALGNDMTDAQWVATPEFGNWKSKVLTGITNTNDMDRIQKNIDSLGPITNTPYYGSWYAELLGANKDRMNKLNSTNPYDENLNQFPF